MLKIRHGGASTKYCGAELLSTNAFRECRVVSGVAYARGVHARAQVMLSVASSAVRENDAPLVKGRRRKFTPDNVARIKGWVAQGVGRDEIASRLEVTTGSLQVTCSRLGISLRKRSSANGNGAIKPHRVVQSSAEERANTPAAVKLTLLIKAQ